MPQKEPVHFFVKLDEVRRALHNERECVADVKQKLDNLLRKHEGTLSWQYLDVETGIPHPATAPQIEGAMRALWPTESAPAIDPSHQFLAAIAGDREEAQRAAKKMQARHCGRAPASSPQLRRSPRRWGCS